MFMFTSGNVIDVANEEAVVGANKEIGWVEGDEGVILRCRKWLTNAVASSSQNFRQSQTAGS